MSERKRKSAEQAPPSKDHSPKQVKEVALMLYAQRPFEIRGAESRDQWQSLVWRAFDFLDSLDKAYAFVVKFRRLAIARDHEERRERALALKLPLNTNELVPFNAAVKFITGEKQRHVNRATANFEMVVFSPHFGSIVFRHPPTKRELRAMLNNWRKNGMSHEEAIDLRWLYKKQYRDIAIATAGKRKRATKQGPRLNKKDKPIIREVNRDKVERDINVSDKQAKRLFRPKH